MIHLLLVLLVWIVPQVHGQDLDDGFGEVTAAGSPVESGEGSGDKPWYVGQTVGAVLLEAADGGLPGDNLEPLLETRQGGTLSPWAVRRDLQTLERIGSFSGVEAHAQPWFWTDAEGELRPAVLLRYVVVPSPRIRRIVVQGAKALPKRVVISSSGVGSGDAFSDSSQAPVIAERVRDAYVEWGFPNAVVSVSVEAHGSREVDFVIEIDEGEPLKVVDVTLVGVPDLIGRKVSRAARRAGLKQGAPYRRSVVLAAREAIEAKLRTHGWLDSRVNPVLLTGEQAEGRVAVRMLIDAGTRTLLVVENKGTLPKRRLAVLLGMDGRRRINDENLAESRESVVEMLQSRGFWAASTQARIDMEGDDRVVTLTIERGLRHYLEAFEFEGATHFSNRLLSQGAKAASPEVLTRLRVTDSALAEAAEYLTEFYRSQGFLDASVEVDEIVVGDPEGATIPLTVRFMIQEGDESRLASLDLDGDLGPGSEVLEQVAEDMLGKPYNPAAVQDVARRIVIAHQESGYLKADATVDTTSPNAEGEISARILIEPGPQVVLRNVVIEGHRHTRRRLIEREVELRTGRPITPSALALTRKNLYELGAFSSISPSLEGDEDRVKDLFLSIEEYKRWAFEVGGGLSTDEGISSFSRATHRNLWGSAHRLNLLLEVGLGLDDLQAPLSDDVEVSPDWLAGVRYEAPNLPNRGQRLFVDGLLNEEEDETTWRSARTGGGLGVQTRLPGEGRLMMDYSVEYRRLACLAPAALVAGDPWSALESGEPEAFCDPPRVESREGGRWVSGPEILLVVDNRDNPRRPTQGMLWTSHIRFADEVLTEDPYVRLESQLLGRVPVGPIGIVMGARGGLGAMLVSEGVLPLEERFRMGGASSLRGFALDSVGPRNRGVSGECADEDLGAGEECWVPTGGDVMVGGTFEIAAPAPLLGLRGLGDMDIVAFLDAGTSVFALQDVETDYAPGDDVDGRAPWLRFGPGIGLRYATPVGPLALDLGFNPWRLERHRESLLRLHFALGAF